RVAIAKAVAGTERRSDDMAILKERFPDDPIAPLVLRAASQPAMLATDTALGRSVVADLIATIGPGGAGTRVLQSGLQLTFDSAGAIYVPGLEATADRVSFVREGAPIPVHGFSATGALLEPRKLAVITALSAEMIAGSNAEALVTDALTRATSLAIDAALFDDVASDEVRPAGLRYAIAASAASASTNPDEPMIADLSALAATVSVIGGPIMFVTAPGRAAVISLRAQRELPFPVLGSPAVAPDDVIAIARRGSRARPTRFRRFRSRAWQPCTWTPRRCRSPTVPVRWRRRRAACGSPTQSASSLPSTRPGPCAIRVRSRG
ncbi:MAG: hypothetical protein WCD75_21450, partial [Rhodoplanes sp.]